MGSLTSPTVVKSIISRYGFRFKKSLGQNFLVDQNTVINICKTASLTDQDLVVEIGPGIGSLTEELAKQAGRVLAVEIDKHLIGILHENLQEFENVSVIHQDVLKLNLDEAVLNEATKWGRRVNSYKIVANLPYYITTPVVMYLLENKYNISDMVVMVQKEVAERMVAPPGGKDYGALTLAINYYTEASVALRVPKTVFMPKPEVDSAVVHLKRRSKPPVELVDEDLFFRVIKAAFGHRRKTLLNAVSSGLGVEKQLLEEILNRCGIDPGRRGETLSLDHFATITNNLVIGKKE